MRSNFMVLLLLFCFGACTSQCLLGQIENNAYERYAEGLIKRYDSDKDGVLEADEISEMRRPISIDVADTNSDGEVSKQELVELVSRKSSNKVASPRKKSSAQGAITNALGGRASGLLSGEIHRGVVQTEKKGSVLVQMDLFEVSNGMDPRQLGELANKFNGKDADIDKLMNALRDNSNVELASSFSFRAQVNREVQLSGQNDRQGNHCSLRATVGSVKPSVEMVVDLQSAYSIEPEAQVEPTQTSHPVKVDREELQQLIQRKIDDRKRELSRTTRSRSVGGRTDSHKRDIQSIHIETSVDCGPKGVAAVHVSNQGQNGLLVIRAKEIR